MKRVLYDFQAHPTYQPSRSLVMRTFPSATSRYAKKSSVPSQTGSALTSSSTLRKLSEPSQLSLTQSSGSNVIGTNVTAVQPGKRKTTVSKTSSGYGSYSSESDADCENLATNFGLNGSAMEPSIAENMQENSCSVTYFSYDNENQHTGLEDIRNDVVMRASRTNYRSRVHHRALHKRRQSVPANLRDAYTGIPEFPVSLRERKVISWTSEREIEFNFLPAYLPSRVFKFVIAPNPYHIL